VYNPPPHIKKIQTNYQLLSEKMDPDSGLLGDLFAQEIITHREMQTVKAGKTSYDRNEELLSVMMRKNDAKFKQFVAALRAANMTDLAGSLEINS